MNTSILANVMSAIARFENGEMEFVELQSRLESAEGALDNGFEEIIKELRDVNADIEEIRFTMLADEQRSAVIFRVDAVKEMIQSTLDQNG